MFEALQDFLQMDSPTFTFFGWFIALGVPFYLAGLLIAGKPTDRSSAHKEPSVRPAPIQFAVDVGKGFVKLVANSGVTPNQITVIGLLLVLFNCGLYVWSGNAFWFGSGLIAALLFDTLDGLVARAQGTSSRFGGFLDAVIDRYQEIAIYLSIGWVTGLWTPVFLIMAGSFLTSYTKARVALEVPTSNDEWPDLLQRPMRLFILCVGLIGEPVIVWFLPFTLWMLVVMTHFTALQRFARAKLLFDRHKQGDPS